MRLTSSYLFVGAALFAMVSCSNSEFKKTNSGLLYKIISDGKNPIAKKGELIKFEVLQKIRDSVLYSSYGSMPGYIMVDSARPVYNPTEVFPLLRKGDSVIVVQQVDTLLRRSGGQMAPFLKKKDKITTCFKVLDVFSSQELALKDREGEVEKQKVRETAIVEGYLQKKGIQAQKTEKGSYYVITDPGNGPAADSGKQISLHYTGRLIPSDKVFESNMTAPGNTPLTFVTGTRQVLPGLDDAIRHFKKGAKGTIFMPAYLAYEQEAKPDHTSFANLAFDLEVIDVTDAPAIPAAPKTPIPSRFPLPAPTHKP